MLCGLLEPARSVKGFRAAKGVSGAARALWRPASRPTEAVKLATSRLSIEASGLQDTRDKLSASPRRAQLDTQVLLQAKGRSCTRLKPTFDLQLNSSQEGLAAYTA